LTILLLGICHWSLFKWKQRRCFTEQPDFRPLTYPFSSGYRIVSRTSSLKRLFFRIVSVFTGVCG